MDYLHQAGLHVNFSTLTKFTIGKKQVVNVAKFLVDYVNPISAAAR